MPKGYKSQIWACGLNGPYADCPHRVHLTNCPSSIEICNSKGSEYSTGFDKPCVYAVKLEVEEIEE